MGNSTNRVMLADYLNGQQSTTLGRNYVLNSSAFQNTNNVTVSGSATVSKNTTTPLTAVSDFAITLSNNTTDSVTWALNTLDNSLNGGNCLLSFDYTASTIGSAVYAQVLQGSNVSGSIILGSATTSRNVSLNVPCGSLASATTVVIGNTTGNSGTTTMNVANVTYGKATNIGSVNQAYLVGTLSVSGCSSSWTTSGTSLAAFSTQSGCVYTATGALLAPTTNIPGFKVSSLAPGDYAVEYEGKVMALSGAGTSATAYYRFSDGTNLAREISSAEGDSGSSAINSGSPGIKQTISYTTAQSNITLQVQGYANSGGTAAIYGTSGQPGVFRLWYFPSSSQQAVRADAVPASWSGYHNPQCNWSYSSTSYADVTSSSSSCALTQNQNRNMGTVTSAGGSGTSALPGITFTPPKAGRYSVSVNFTAQSIKNTNQGYQLIDSNGVQLAEIGTADGGLNLFIPITLSGILNAPSASPITVKLQSKCASASSSCSDIASSSGVATQGVVWSIVALDSPMPAPLLVNSVTSSSAGVTRIESAIIHNNGSTCSATSQAGGNWISGGSRPQGGQCQVNFNAGIFSAAPICQITANTSIGWVPGYPSRQCTPNTNASTSGILVDCYYSSSGASSTYTDLDFNITCYGAH